MSDNENARVRAASAYPYPSPLNRLVGDPTPADQAVYVPSVSPSYATAVLKGTWGRSLPNGVQPGDLNFLDPANSLFRISHVMSSAGQALKQGAACIITTRDRSRTRLICDSGGYQVASGLLQINSSAQVLSILRWMERHGDYAITLDVPTGPLLKRNKDYQFATFRDCLGTTLGYLDFFVKNRKPGAVQLLNVLHRNDLSQADAWYQAVKGYPFEGWAFAGALRHDFYALCRRIIQMAREHLLEDRDWIHVLGTCELDVAVLLTALQRAINRHINPRLRISFDTASPFKMLRFGRVYTLPKFSASGMEMGSVDAPDHPKHVGSPIRWTWPSPLGDRMTLGDFCVPLQGGRTRHWDDLSNIYHAHHNLAALCFGIALANRVFDGENVSQMHTVAPHVGTAVQAIAEVIRAGTDAALQKFARTFARLKHNAAAINDTGDDERAYY